MANKAQIKVLEEFTNINDSMMMKTNYEFKSPFAAKRSGSATRYNIDYDEKENDEGEESPYSSIPTVRPEPLPDY